MLKFSTKFPVKPTLTRELLIKKAENWVNNSQNFQFINLKWDGSNEFLSKEGEQAFEIICQDDLTVIHVVNPFETNTWTTDFILDTSGDIPVIATQLYMEATSSYNKVQVGYHLPLLLKSFFTEDYLDSDCGLSIVNSPIQVEDIGLNVIADIINRKTLCMLPVVYISNFFRTQNSCANANKIAEELRGLAHVVTEKHSCIQKDLKLLTNGLNPYNGDVIIYFPDGSQYKIREVYDKDRVDSIICKKIRSYSVQAKIEDRHLYHKVKYNLLLQKYDGDSELVNLCDDVIKEQEADLRRCKEIIRELQSTINKQNTKIENLADGYNRALRQSDLNLKIGETELYPGELEDVVIRTLQKEYYSMSEDPNLCTCRKYHVLSSILDNNNMTDIPREVHESLRSISDSGSFDRKRLEDLGFSIEGSKHLRLIFAGDERYNFTVAKSTSDNRSLKNLISIIYNTIFGY